MHLLKTIGFLSVAVIISIANSNADQSSNEISAIQVRRTEFKRIYDQLKPLQIYGKVIDINGIPVAGAEVKVGWESATFLMGRPDSGQVSWITTDAAGLWELKIEKPRRAFVEEVKKQGFEYTTLYNQDGCVRNLVEKRTAVNSPVVTVIRPKGEATFLIHRDKARSIRVYSSNPETNSLDFLAERMDKLNAGSYADIQIAIDYSRTSGVWTVAFSATNGMDGIVVSNSLLYEAPQNGYEKQIVVSGDAQPRYLYLRSRSPAIYSRLNLDSSIWKGSETNQNLSISYNVWINPYGSRNLEYETDLAGQWQLREQLEKSARADLLQGKLPPSPDLPKLIKEAKEKAEKARQ